MPLQQTSGNVTTDAYGGGVAVEPNYIESVFSTYLYTGNSSTQTINNGIDLSTKGGLVWIKNRTSAANHGLVDTARGVRSYLSSDSTAAAYTNVSGYDVTAFNTNGFSLGPSQAVSTNTSGDNYVSWSLAKAPKFFDVVTYTGNGANRTIAHNLGSVPGFMIVKCTSTTSNWATYHRSLSAGNNLTYLNLTNASTTSSNAWNNTAPTATEFSVGGTSSLTNTNGATYVAYLFAHDAGGFGLTGTDNVISCGSYTGNGSATRFTAATLGYEPQWLLIKNASGGTADDNWFITDCMTQARLLPNTSGAEVGNGYWFLNTTSSLVIPTATGFDIQTNAGSLNTSGSKYIYIAIRRGPMKVPTDATKVFAPKKWTGTGATANVTGIGFPPDLWMTHGRDIASQPIFEDRLRGATQDLFPNQTTAETTQTSVTSFASMDGVTFGTDSGVNLSTYLYINYAMRRAPSFFDEVCYTGTGTTNGTISHNLGVAPELIILKPRTAALAWSVWTDFTSSDYIQLALNTTSFAGSRTSYSTTARLGAKPTSTTITFGGVDNYANGSANTYVAYLFATCAGVSKVFSFTGTGSLQTINCGFTSGARFVLVKRTDSTGDWYVWDSARGISSSTDPYLLLNSTAAEVTSTNWVDTTSTGFQVTAASGNNVNINGATYIGIAIA